MNSQILLKRESKKKASKRFILTLMHEEGAISQTRIVERTSIRPGTAQRLIEELIGEKLVRVSGEGKSKGGRKPTLLEINPDACWTIGMDVDEERIFAGLVDLKGSIIRQVSRTRCRFLSQENFLGAVIQVIRELVAAVPPAVPLLGVGMGIPGFVDRARGVAVQCSYYDWMRDVPVKELLEKELHVPFLVENDTVIATLGEKWFGSGKGVWNFLYIDLGETVGMGIVIDGRLYTGATGYAGEMGHMVIQRGGPLCICGNEGCLEAVGSGMALRREARNRIEKGVITSIGAAAHGSNEIPLEAIIEAADAGDKVAHKLIQDTGESLGVAISSVVNILNPEMVILGGSLMGAKEILTEVITKSIRSHSLSPIAAGVKVVASGLAEKAGILGASTLVTQRYFDFDQPPGQPNIGSVREMEK
jgi:glucokinase-like ROK family protein